MRTKYKPWAKPYIEEHFTSTISLEEIETLKHPVYLEIGSGKGQFIVEMAKKNPSIFFIGVEKNISCCGFTLKKIVEEKVNNAKLYVGDGEKVVEVLKDKTVKNLFLNFANSMSVDSIHNQNITPNFANFANFATLYFGYTAYFLLFK